MALEHLLRSTRGRRHCPPHGPLMVHAIEGGDACVVECMRCGIRGPGRRDGVEAKQAFDEALGKKREPKA